MSATVPYSIFVSYRRSDARGFPRLLHLELASRFPGDDIFLDVLSLDAGARWTDRLEATLETCNVIVVIIGPDWLSVSNETGRRLDDPLDRVRLELEAGIRRGVPLVPTLVGGARMPSEAELPESLKPLYEWQAVRVSDESWDQDVERLAGAIVRARESPPAPAELGVGAIFAGHRIEALVGRGGMGIVYRARHVGLDRVDAIKVIAPEFAGDRTFQRRFVQESRVTSSLRHPNVVTVYDAGEERGLLYLAMEFVDGRDLAAILAHEGPLSAAHTAEILSPAANALQAAHESGLIHRDVKPGNILIAEGGGKPHVYLVDFGLARQHTTSTGLTSTGRWVGTPDYVSPEQIMGETVDARSDIYAMGCVLFEMLTGRVPYPAPSDSAKLVAHATQAPPNLRELSPDLPADLDAVVRTAMARDPGARYPTVSDFREALTQAAAAGTGSARPSSRPRAADAVGSADRDEVRADTPAPSDARYRQITEAMLARGVIVFLGPDTNSRGHDASADGGASAYDVALARYLAQRWAVPPELSDLAAVAQYVSTTRGDADLFGGILHFIADTRLPGGVEDYLVALPDRLEQLSAPRRHQVIVATTHDTALEHAFLTKREPFDAVVYAASRGEFIHVPADADPVTISHPDQYGSLPILDDLTLARPLIVRINGAVRDPGVGYNWDVDHASGEELVVTQDDYIRYLGGALSELVPIQLLELFGQQSYLFLGHTITRWWQRVFLRRLWRGQRLARARHWAIERASPELSDLSWRELGVDPYESPVPDFLAGLERYLASTDVAFGGSDGHA